MNFKEEEVWSGFFARISGVPSIKHREAGRFVAADARLEVAL
jgi:hypothetical protein